MVPVSAAIPSAAINAALAALPLPMDSLAARVMLAAIGLQESRFTHRFQVVAGKPRAKGPARGFWQFERGGGCVGVLNHAASRYWMRIVCAQRGCKPTPAALWRAIETDDVLAAAAARLLLFTDPKRLPPVGDDAGAWALYMRVWRPGKPHRNSWPTLYAQAMQYVHNTTEADT
jgi:hypothetical protein